MKKGVKKTRPGSSGFPKKAEGKKTVKKKNRKKLAPEDKFRAVLIAAFMILAAGALSLGLVYYNLTKSQTGAVLETGAEKPPAPEGKSAEEEPRPGGTQTAAEKPSSPESGHGAANSEIPAENAPAAGQHRPAAGKEESAVSPPRPAGVTESRTLPAASPPPAGVTEQRVSKGALVFVIDDAGHNLRDLEPFLSFPGPLTIAVLPGLPHSAEAARRVRAAGKEVFLHQPMEALGGQDPGPGAIRAGMGRDEIREIIGRNLDEVGPVAGINNHEGSRITMSGEAMETVLSLCRERGILFLDSRTTAETAVPGTARRLGMVIGERDVFVDNVQARESMAAYIETGLKKAEQKGSVIMIGHVWSPELPSLLAEMFPDLNARGYSFSPASKIIGGR